MSKNEEVDVPFPEVDDCEWMIGNNKVISRKLDPSFRHHNNGYGGWKATVKTQFYLIGIEEMTVEMMCALLGDESFARWFTWRQIQHSRKARLNS